MNRKNVTVNVMAPLVVGDPSDLNSAASQAAWRRFDKELAAIKQLGAEAVSTDVWWKLVEPQDGVFTWSYYDRIASSIKKAGLKWVPILSFHKCGGNIGDDVTVKLPDWVWKKVAARTSTGKIADVQFVSEFGNASDEYVSFWATDLVLDCYVRMMRAFQEHYAPCAADISEVNISVGPSGELRYPSYNKHDEDTDYPTRGGLQAYSRLACESFQFYIMRKYGSIEGLNKAWGAPLDPTGHKIEPPRNVNRFFRDGGQLNTQYGRDFFDWYSDSLIEHGRKVLTAAIGVFGADDAAFKSIDLGAKVPGVHWRMGINYDGQILLGDRLAELSAGLIRTSRDDWQKNRDGRGYRPLVSLFNELQKKQQSGRFVLHFTCLEMADGEGVSNAFSLAGSLVSWLGQEAVRQQVTIKGENALGPSLASPVAFERIRAQLAFNESAGLYSGITFLRMSDILRTQMACGEFARTAALAR